MAKAARRRSWCKEFSLVWLFPLVVKGYRERYDEEATPPLPEGLRARRLVPRAHALWSHEKKRKRRYGLVRVLAKLSWPYLLVGMIMSVLQGLTTAVARPLLIRALISELEGGERDDSTLLMYVGLLAAALLVEGYSSVSLKHALSDFLGSLWFTTAGALIQRQALSIPGGVISIQESSLLGNDLMRTFENLKFMCLLPMSIIALLGGVTVLVISIGKASVVGLLVMAVILVINGRLAHLAQLAEEQDLDASDARLSLLSQVISSIKAIKLSAWEDSFGELVKQARVLEMSCLARYRTLSQSGVQLGRATPTVCAAVSFIYMVSVTDNVNAADVFAALNVFLNLRLPLILIPECITYLGALQITLHRLDRYLRLEPVEAARAIGDDASASEVPDRLTLKGSYAWHGGMIAQDMAKRETAGSAPPPTAAAAPSLAADGAATASFSNFTAFMLQDLDISIPRGARCAVLGEVGSGKSSLLAAILGELKAVSPASRAPDAGANSFASMSKAFVPQASFVISGTIRENLLFGHPDPHDDAVFERALRRSALWDDLQRFPRGLDTAVGERGVTLSGGQKARLAVARALYARPQLYVFDDVLAAVDAPICRHLLEHVFEGMDEGGTLVASINQYAFLDKFTHYVWLGKNGRVARQGELTPDLITEIQRELERVTQSLDDDNGDPTAGGANKGDHASAGEAGGQEHEDDAASERTMESELLDREPSILSTGSRRMSSAARPGQPTESSDPAAADDESRVSDDLVKVELRTKGSIAWRVIRAYARGMGYHYLALAAVCGVCAYASMALSDLWLAAYLRRSDEPGGTSNLHFALVYGAGCISFLVFLMLTSGIFSFAGVRASQGLHDQCMEKVLHAPISWFEATPSGRILSRFSTDIGIVDQQLSRFSDNLFQLTMTTLALIVVVVVLVPPVLAAVAVSAVLYSFQVVAVDRTNREVKRSVNMAMSPVQTIVNESVQGRLSLRAFSSGRGADDQATILYFQERFWDACDAWNEPSFISLSLVNFSMLLAYFISFIISTSVGVVIVLDKDLDPSSAALSLTYSLLVSYFGLHAAFIYSIVKVSLASLERVLEFVSDDVPQEPEWRLPDDPMTIVRIEKERLFAEKASPPAHKRVGDLEQAYGGAAEEPGAALAWPQEASIRFVDVGLVYRPGLPFSLRHVSFEIEAQERVAIVGKSGAGKSSIIGLLFRVYPLTEGKIIIGGRDIGSLGLVTLREAFSVIPQEPLLLAGTVRKNLDPFGAFEHENLIQALLQSGIAQSRGVAVELLEVDIGDNASALSAGQRQLLSFARIILQPRPIIVCDEPTSFLDEASDSAVQRVLRNLPGTKLMIAHRLNTIVSSDKIIVMDKGRVAEIGTPSDLLQTTGGLFRTMAVAANLQHEALLSSS